MKYLLALLIVSCATLPKVPPMSECERACRTKCEFRFQRDVGQQMVCELECDQLVCHE